MRKIGLIICVIFFIFSVALNGLIIFWVLSDDGIDQEFAQIAFDGEIETREYKFDEFCELTFFYDRDPLTDFSKLTRYLGAIPHLKIVNSNEYKVEITANSDAFDKLKIGTSEDRLVITMADDCYVPVHTDDPDYDYDTGLYITMEKFDVTVYAPIQALSADGRLTLDYQAPTCEVLSVNCAYFGVDGKIYDIDCDKLFFYCSATSNVSLQGRVKGLARMSIWHNTKVDASELEINQRDFYISTQYLGGLSYIKHGGIYHLQLFGESQIMMAFIKLPPFLWLACIIDLVRKRRA